MSNLSHPPPALKQNNFDLLRLVFAMMVCLVHISELSGNPSFEILSRLLSSALAVKAFFVVSGFLIFMSYERARSLRDYAGKRARRIAPAYLLVIVASALVLPAMFASGGERYLTIGWLKYLAFNAIFLNFLQPTLPGVFTELKVQAVNGALWTLKVEVMFYMAVPLLATLMAMAGRARVLVGTYVLSLAYAYAMAWMAQRTGRGVYLELGRQLPGQLSYFMAGAALYYYFPDLMRRLPASMAAACAVLLADRWLPLSAIEPLALAVVVVGLAYGIYVGNFSKYGDFSYGLYIVHFPIIQSLLGWGLLDRQPLLFMLVAIAGTLLAAAALWHGVEKHFMARGSHYRAEDGLAAPSR